MEAALADPRRLGDRGPVTPRLAPDPNDVPAIDAYGAGAPVDLRSHLDVGFGTSRRVPSEVSLSGSA